MQALQSILFSGYAPVHFLCFEPLYRRLRASGDFEVFLSGGIRSRDANGKVVFDHQALYSRFDVNPDHVLSVDEIRTRAFDMLFSANMHLIKPGKVRQGTVQIFQSQSFCNRDLQPANMNCDHYFITGPYMKRRLVAQGLMKENDPRMVPVGFMKTDRLVDGSLNRSVVMSAYGLDGSRPVIVYAPTGAKYNSLNNLGEAVIKRLRDSGKYDLLIKLHDHPEDDINWQERLAAVEDKHTIVVRNDDVIPLLQAADLLISDASSVSSEFSLCDKPMVFLDVPKLLARLESVEYRTMDIDTWGRKGGLLVRSAREICAAVDKALREAELLSPLRQQMSQDLFYNQGKATDVAVSWLREQLAFSRQLAAA